MSNRRFYAIHMVNNDASNLGEKCDMAFAFTQKASLYEFLERASAIDYHFKIVTNLSKIIGNGFTVQNGLVVPNAKMKNDYYISQSPIAFRNFLKKFDELVDEMNGKFLYYLMIDDVAIYAFKTYKDMEIATDLFKDAGAAVTVISFDKACQIFDGNISICWYKTDEPIIDIGLVSMTDKMNPPRAEELLRVYRIFSY